MKELQEEIERIRLNLVHIVVKKGPVSTDAICVSKALDNKINEYLRLKK